MRLAVVLPGVAVRGDLDFGFVLPDLQRAGHVGDNIVRGYVVVVFVNDDRGLRHKLILVHANHGLAAVDGNRLHLVAIREVFRRVAGADLDLTRGIQLRAVRLAVVVDGVVRGDDLHKVLLVQTAFGDGQLAILHDEGYRREVTVPVHEAVLREVHEVVARVRALSVRRRAVGKAEVRFRVQRVADAHDLVAVHFMLLAVVLNRVLSAPDLHDHFGLHGRNRQLAGGLGDGVVLGNVHVVLIENLHRAGERAYVLALIRALGCVGQVFIPVTGLQTNNRDVGDGLLAAVVHLLSAFAREGHDEARVGDGQLAGGLGNVVVLRYIVALSVLNNHVAAERAVVAANILAFRLIGQAFVSVTLHKAALRDAGNALHAAGVGEGLAFAGEGHAARGNGQRALPALGEGVARGHVGFAAHDPVARYHVVAAADVRLAALDNRGQNVALHQRARVGEAVIRQRRAVVNLLVALRGDGNGLALALALRDGQLAFILGDGIVRLLEVRAFGEGDRVGHFALVHEGYAAGGLDIGHLARHKAVAAHGDIRLRQRRAVVFLARRLGGQRYGALVDGQAAVGHDELDVREVLAVVPEVAYLQTHRIGIRARSLHLGGAGEGEVRFLIKLVADAYVVARHGMLRAVIRHGILVTRDRHDHFGLHGRNRQLAGGLGDGVVLGNVHVVLIENLHRAGERAYVLALIRALGCVGQVFIPVTGLQTNNRDVGDGLLAAVVHLLSAFAREGHDEARVGDGQLAGGLGNVVVLRYIVALSVLNNHVAAERAVVAANILAFRLIGQAFVSVTLHKAALRDAGNALHAAGVGEGLAFAGEGHAARGNGQRALPALGEGVARGHVGFAAHDPVARYHVVAAADVRLAALDNRGQNVALHQRARVGEAVIRQRRAVVNLLVALRGDGNGLALALALRDGQLAFILGDGIVRLLEVRAFGEGDRVGHFALVHEGYAAGGLDIGHLARHKAVAAHGDIRLRQRRAVVFLARRLGGQCYGALVDGQLAVDGISEGVVPGHVHVAAHDLVALNDVFAFVAHVRGAALDDRRQLVAFHQHAFGEGEAAIRQRGSVVGLVFAVRGDDDRVFRDRVDLQNAVHDLERYVREVLIRVLEVTRGDAHGVFASVRALRSPRGGFGRLDAGSYVVQRVVSRHGLVALDAVLGAVVGNDRAVLGDGNGNLVGHGGDRHIAVNHCLDGHVVVGAGDGEGVLCQTHGRRANVRASGDGEYIGLGADRNLVRLAGEAVVVAVRLVLLAVVHMRFIDARDGDGGRSLVDGQRAVCIGYIIIGRNCVAVVFDGAFINHVRGTARVGDGGFRRHGESEVLLRVAVDQTLHCEIGLGQRLAVVGLIRVLGLDGQGHSVIDRDDIFGFVSRDRDGLRGDIAGHTGGGIGGIERIALVRRQLFADGLGAGLVVGNLDGGAVQVMMDGVARGVELEVQLQHQRAVAFDNAGLNVGRGLVVDVLVVILRRLIGVGHGNGRVRGGRASFVLLVCRIRIRSVRVLIVELDGVLGVGVRRPDGVEDVLAVVVVYLHLRVGGDGAFALGVGVPALEGVADAGEGVCDGGNGLVIGEVFNHVRACAAIGLIGQGCAGGTSAPLGGEGDDVPFISVIALDLILVAGLVGGRAVRPAEEVLAIISNQLARGLEVSKAVLRVGLAIHRSGYVVLAGNIFYSEGAVLGVVGVEGDIRCDPGLGVEGLAGAVLAGTPAAPGIAFANLRHDFRLLIVQRGFNRVALRDAECNR